MKTAITCGAISLLGLAIMVGCSNANKPNAAAATGVPSAEGRKFIAASEPSSARDVKVAREEAKEDEEVVIVGRIGGDVKPFVEGIAAFSIVDRSLKACSDIPGDACPTPWDYCCETTLPENTVTIKFVDAQGNPLSTGAKELLGVKELDTVVIRGQAKRSGANLIVLAKEMYVKK